MGGFSMSGRRTFLKQSVIGAGALTLGMIPPELFASGQLKRLTIMHTNDMHCRIDPFPDTNAEYARRGGMVRLASLISQTRAANPNMLLLDAGDMFQGTPYFNYFKGDLMLKLMSHMGYDAGTIGNHEFDNGMDGLAASLPFAKFPIISSNYDFSDTPLSGMVTNHLIMRKQGIKVGIYGLGIELEGLVAQSGFGNTRYLDPLAIALQMEQMLKVDHSCDLVICLSHLGIAYKEHKISDSSLAPLTRYTDLIIGGHTHTFLEKPLEFQNKEGRLVLVNQAGWGALMAGSIEFIVDRSGKNKTFIAEVNNL